MVKHFLIKYRRKNTNKWIVQTISVRDQLKLNLNVSEDLIEIIPFFEEKEIIDEQRPVNDIESFFYPAVGLPHKNHILLLNTWQTLCFTEKFNHQLHLTIDFESDLGKKIRLLQENGVSIINHGYLNKTDIAKLYKKCKFTIHPSIGESFGLVLIEALQNGCILIAPNLPYVKAIVKPNYFFDVNDPKSLFEIIKKALSDEKSPSSLILVKNDIQALINLLLN